MTEQEVFNRIAAHLLTQNVRSLDSHGNCMYRGPAGLKCAAGIFIPDSRYCSSLENIGCSAKVIKNVMEPEVVGAIDLIREAQSIHDYYDPCEWAEKLKTLAAEFNLNTDIIKQHTAPK